MNVYLHRLLLLVSTDRLKYLQNKKRQVMNIQLFVDQLYVTLVHRILSNFINISCTGLVSR